MPDKYILVSASLALLIERVAGRRKTIFHKNLTSKELAAKKELEMQRWERKENFIKEAGIPILKLDASAPSQDNAREIVEFI